MYRLENVSAFSAALTNVLISGATNRRFLHLLADTSSDFSQHSTIRRFYRDVQKINLVSYFFIY
jgi:hypothetical protein